MGNFMRRHTHIRVLGIAAIATVIVQFAPASATIIGAGDITPASILGLPDADVTGQGVIVEDGTLTVNGGSSLTADSLTGAFNSATTNSNILITGPGTVVGLTGGANRIDIGNQGVSNLTVSDGAVIDGASTLCDPNLCNTFFGNFAGATSNLTVTGAGSRIDSRNALIFGASKVFTPGDEGTAAGTPGGVTTATAQILDGGVVNAFGTSSAAVIGLVSEGSGNTGAEQSNANVTVDGSGSALNVSLSSGGLDIALGTNATGTLNIQNQGQVNVTTSAVVGNDGGIGTLNVNTGGSLNVTDVISVGQNGGFGVLNVETGGQVNAAILRADDGVNGDGTVNVIGPGSTITLDGFDQRLTIGQTATGRLNISGGAVVNAGVDAATCASSTVFCGSVIGNGAGSTGIVDISGEGSSLLFTDLFRIAATHVSTQAVDGFDFATPGGTTNATVDVRDGALLSGDGFVIIGQGPTDPATLGTEQGLGVLNITGQSAGGVSSTLEITQTINVGQNIGGDGTLSVSFGGSFDGTFMNIGQNGGIGTLNIDGSGTGVTSKLITMGRGAAADGTLNITDRATVTIIRPVAEQFPGINVARDANDAVGRVVVDGVGTTVLMRGNTAFTNAGRNGDGGLEILGGATYTLESIDNAGGAGTSSILQVGRSTGAVGNMRVSNATVSLSGTGQASVVRVGRDSGATGTLLIEAGGKVLNNDAQGRTVIGREIGSVGAVTVTGAGSELLAGRDLFVGLDVSGGVAAGNGGTGTLTVADSGLVTAETIQIGNAGLLTGAGGIIDANVVAFDGGVVAPGSSPGDMFILGGLDLSGGGILEIEFGGIDLGQFDRLFIGGGFVVDATTSIVFSFFDGAAGDPDLLQGFDLSAFFFNIDPQNFEENNPTANAAAFDAAVFSAATFSARGSKFIGEIDVDGDGGLQVVNVTFTTVPEPGPLALFGIALAGLGLVRRRRSLALPVSSLAARIGRRSARILDAGAALVLLIYFAPCFAAVAAVLRLSGPGPLFQKREAITSDGRRVWLLRFRTNSPTNARRWQRNLQGFLQISRLDDLPLLINVLCGDTELRSAAQNTFPSLSNRAQS